MIQIIAVGKLKEKATKQLVDEYLKRLQPYCKTEILEVNDEPNDSLPEKSVKEIEGERIIKAIRKGSYVILLELTGKQMDSISLAKKLSDTFTYQSSDITFIIGGSLGVSEAVKEQADFMWKLSELTFPHNLVRIMLVEQIYRAFKINNHEPYHK